ncbi:Hypothethical protein [Paraburkholderia ribeironis]|uniref:Hypothethical protein n=1 Tax=Paraburkholderia ribeironis TaxID=1247936 RepID=A0A1N7SNX1_9BURK|nr:hypothetical protein [Paraburkholderia ribeironis]SIT49041.1 Hypothethical protein [Paraburkholderia ribeironis]
MESSELFFQLGRLSLTKEQSSQIESALGKSVESVPLFRVVAVSAEDRYVPLAGIPGVAGVIVHYGQQPEKKEGGQVIASLLDEMAMESDVSPIFAAHTKLMAPHSDAERLESNRAKSKSN